MTSQEDMSQICDKAVQDHLYNPDSLGDFCDSPEGVEHLFLCVSYELKHITCILNNLTEKVEYLMHNAIT